MRLTVALVGRVLRIGFVTGHAKRKRAHVPLQLDDQLLEGVHGRVSAGWRISHRFWNDLDRDPA